MGTYRVGDGPWAHSSVSGSGENATKLWQREVSDTAGAEIMMLTGTTPAESESGIFKKQEKWPRDKVYVKKFKKKKSNGYIPNS